MGRLSSASALRRLYSTTGAAPSKIIVSRRTDGFATVTLNSPEVHNAFSDVMIAELSGAFKSLREDAGAPPQCSRRKHRRPAHRPYLCCARSAVRGLFLRANGTSFCAGADLSWMKRAASFTWEVCDQSVAYDQLRATWLNRAPRSLLPRHCYRKTWRMPRV